MPLNPHVASGIRWSSLSQYSQQGLMLATTAILSRLLTPSDFGLLSMALVVTRLPMMFKDLGTASGVIQHEDPSDALLASVFWLNIAFGLSVALVIFAIAPMVSTFFDEPAVAPLLRALSTLFLFWGPRTLFQALLERDLNFAAVARAELIGAAAGAIAAIVLAFNGQGVWSLIALHTVPAAITSALIWRECLWRPKVAIQWSALRDIMRYSASLTAYNALNFFSRNADNIIIGRVLGAQALGYYTLAYTLMLSPLKSVSGVIGKGLLPSFVKMRKDHDIFRQEYLKICGLAAAVSFPMMFTLMALSDPLIVVLFGDHWRPVSPLIQILAPVGMVQSILTFNGAIYQATGRTERQFRLELLFAPLIIASFILGLRWGVLGVAGSYAVMSFTLAVPSVVVAYGLIGLSLTAMAKVLLRPLGVGIILALALAGMRAALPSAVTHAVVVMLALPMAATVYYWSVRRLLAPEFARFQELLRA